MRIPVPEDNSVQLRALPGGGLQAADFGSGVDVRGLARGLSDVSDAQAQIDTQMDNAAVKSSVAQLSAYATPILHTNDDAFYRQTGQNALNARKGVEEGINSKFNELNEGLKSDRQKRMFSEIAGQERDRYLAGVGDYAGKQARVYEDQSDSALQYQMGNAATEAAIAGDEKGFAVSLGTLKNSIRAQGARNGLSGLPAQLEESKAVDRVYSDTIERMAGADPAKANEYFQKNIDNITDSGVKAKIAKLVQAPLEDQQNDQFAQLVRGTGGPPTSTPNKPDGVPDTGRWPAAKLGEVAKSIPGAIITSGVRSAEHNAEVGGVPNSQHVSGTALDFVAPGQSVEQVRQHFADAGAKVTVLQHDAGSGMHFHVQGSSRTAAVVPVNAPQHTDLNTQLAQVDTMAANGDWTYARTQGVKARLMQLAAIDERLKNQDEKDAGDAAWGVALDPGTTSVRQIPPGVWARLEPSTQRSIMAQMKHNASPEAIPNNPDLYYKLSTVAANNPAEFAKLDLRPYATQLPPGDWKAFNNLQRSAIKEGEKSPKVVAYSRIWGLSSSAFQAAGFKTGQSAKPADKAIQTQFMGKMLDEVQSYTDTHGKPPTDNDIVGIRDKLLMTVDVVTPGRLYGENHTETPVFQAQGHLQVAIPNSVRNRIITSYQRTHSGQMPSEQAIGTTYLQNKGDLWQ